MNVLITGAGGFIGKNVLERLGDKYNFIPLRHSEVDITNCKAVEEFIKGKNVQAILHTATKPGHRKAVDKTDLVASNLKLFTSVLKVAEDNGIKLLSIRSGSEYDMYTRSVDKIKEEDFGKVIPLDDTGYPRYIMNKLIRGSQHAVNLRCFGVYGKYEDYTMRFISNCIAKAISGKDITINQDKEFSYIYIDDLVDVIDLFLQKDCKEKDYNIVPDEIVTMQEIATLVKEMVNPNIKVEVLGKGNNYTGDNSRFKKEFDFKFTTLKDSLKPLVSYYESIKNEIKEEEL